MHKYRPMGKKGEGTFSEVLKAQDTKTGKYVAIKCMKNHFDSVEQVNRLREIQALRRLSPHANIIKLHEVLFDRSTGRLALVFELMDMNIYEMIRGRRQYIAEDKILHFMYQMIKGVDHMHRNGIFHRDIKPENVLVCGDALKLADFGSCRGIYSKQPYTEYISTRWYRAPMPTSSMARMSGALAGIPPRRVRPMASSWRTSSTCGVCPAGRRPMAPCPAMT